MLENRLVNKTLHLIYEPNAAKTLCGEYLDPDKDTWMSLTELRYPSLWTIVFIKSVNTSQFNMATILQDVRHCTCPIQIHTFLQIKVPCITNRYEFINLPSNVIQ